MFVVRVLQGLGLQPWSNREFWEGEGSCAGLFMKQFHGMKSSEY